MKRKLWRILLVFQFLLGASYGAGKTRRLPLYVRARYAGICQDYPGDITGNLTLAYAGRKFLVNGWADTLRRCEKIEKAIISIHNCKNSAEEKNCELFQTWRFGTESCNLMQQKGALWSPIFQAYQPPLKCPIEKTRYNIVNASLDPSSLIDVFGEALLQRFFWRVRINVIDYRLFTGICVGLEFIHGKH